MKILHVADGIDPQGGGPHLIILPLVKALKASGVKVELACINTDANKVKDLAAALDIPFYCFESHFPKKYVFSLPFFRWLKQQVKNYDIIHIHSVFTWTFLSVAYLSKLYKKAYIVRTCGVLNPWCLKKNWFFKKCYIESLGRKGLNGAAAVHFTSEEEASVIKRLNLKVPGLVIPHGIDEIYLNNSFPRDAFRNKFPSLQEKKIILFLSRIDPKKGLELLLDAVKILSEKRDDFVLVIAGSGKKAYEEKIKSIVQDYRLGEKIIFPGLVHGKDKFSLLKDADIFVLPSYDENFGIAVTEAMASGLPVCVAKGVNISDKIKEYEAGIVTGYRPEEIANALGNLLEDRKLCINMGNNGKKLVAEVYNWQIIGGRLKEVYERIISGKGLSQTGGEY